MYLDMDMCYSQWSWSGSSCSGRDSWWEEWGPSTKWSIQPCTVTLRMFSTVIRFDNETNWYVTKLEIFPESTPKHSWESDSFPSSPVGSRNFQSQDGSSVWICLGHCQSYLLHWILFWNTQQQNCRILGKSIN